MDRPNKNQVDVTIGGEVLTLRATFDFFDAAGESFDEVGRFTLRASEGLPAVAGMHRHVLKVLSEGIRAAGETPDDERLKKLIEDEGVTGTAMALQGFFVAAHYGGKAFEDNAQKKTDMVKGEPTGPNLSAMQ